MHWEYPLRVKLDENLSGNAAKYKFLSIIFVKVLVCTDKSINSMDVYIYIKGLKCRLSKKTIIVFFDTIV
eukprot:snap_masked-scaffold_35-processed-gene-0.10-mRNA-1 protein AED:1.00 eAED:1.00 QI:0/0/0/0/1/1/2/0/69